MRGLDTHARKRQDPLCPSLQGSTLCSHMVDILNLEIPLTLDMLIKLLKLIRDKRKQMKPYVICDLFCWGKTGGVQDFPEDSQNLQAAETWTRLNHIYSNELTWNNTERKVNITKSHITLSRVDGGSCFHFCLNECIL